MGRLAILDRFECEHRPPRQTEKEYEKKYEKYRAPKSSSVLSFFESWSPATSVTIGVI
jgi:hypothetical protein